MKKILVAIVISHLAGFGFLDTVQVKWQKESCCFVVLQGSPKREYSVLLNGQRDTTDLVMRADTTFKIDITLIKEVVFILE